MKRLRLLQIEKTQEKVCIFSLGHIETEQPFLTAGCTCLFRRTGVARRKKRETGTVERC